MKKQMSVILALAVSASMLASFAVRAEEAETVGHGEHYTLGTAMTAPPDENCKIEVYWEDRLNLDFDLVYLEEDNYSELLNLEIASGNSPDVFTVTGRDNLVSLYEQGAVGGFTKEFLQENAPLIYNSIVEEMGPNAFDVVSVDGVMYALPYQNVEMKECRPVIWNMNWLKAIGFEGTPTTLDEFEECLRKFVTDDPDGDGEDDTYGFSLSALDMFYGAFGCAQDEWMLQDDGTIAYDMMQDGFKDALAWLAEMYADGVLDPEYITGENHGGYWAISHAFGEGRIGLSGLGAFYHWPTQDALDAGLNLNSATAALIKETGSDIVFDYGNHPVGPNGDYGIYNPNAFATMEAAFSPALVADEERFKTLLKAMEYMGGLHDIEDGLISRYGILGEDWEYGDDGSPRQLESTDTLEKWCAIGGNGALVPFWPPRLTEASAPYEFKWLATKFADYQIQNIISVKIYDVLPAVLEYKAELDTFLDEAKTDIITGKQPIEYYDEAVEKAKAMGYDEMFEQMNEAYQAHLAE